LKPHVGQQKKGLLPSSTCWLCFGMNLLIHLLVSKQRKPQLRTFIPDLPQHNLPVGIVNTSYESNPPIMKSPDESRSSWRGALRMLKLRQSNLAKTTEANAEGPCQGHLLTVADRP
jgi:hypothetical protein